MKVQNPIIGRAKGSAGGMTFSKVYDKNVARAKAFEVNNPKTQAQQTQRAFFADLTALCSDFSDAQLRTLFPQKPKTMSRRNAISKQIAEYYAVDGTTKSIDFDDIDTLGNAPVMDFGTTTTAVVEGVLKVTLDNTVKQNQALRDFYFLAVMINVTKGEISLTTSCATVSTGVLSPAIPPTWALSDDINAIPMISDSKSNLSSVGFGSFIIKVRPEKKNR